MSIALEHVNYIYSPGTAYEKRALNDISLEIGQGQFVGIIGHTGSGKSTLIQHLNGLMKATSGDILYDGQSIYAEGYDMRKLRSQVGLVFQYPEHQLFEVDVISDVCFGPKNQGLSEEESEKNAREALELVGFPEKYYKQSPFELSGGQKRRVAIAGVLAMKPKVLILDEPTSSLDDDEVEKLFTLMRKLREEGVGIIFVTHFLEQVYEVCDKITVLRNGELVGEYDVENLPRVQLVAKMMGKDFDDLADIKSERSGEVKEGDPVIEAVGVSHHGSIKPFDITFNKGEVVGLTGLLGSGRSELVRAIYGADKADTGEVKVFGKKVKINAPLDAMKAGMAYLPEDRKKDGILADLSVRENIIIALQAKRGMFKPMKRKEMEDAATNFIKLLQIKTASMETPIKSLSGGNQQKVILGRWLLTNPRFLILDEPTRGIDIGTKTEIQKLVLRLADEGKSIAFISSEVEEMLRTCSRMAVLRDGKKVGEIKGDDLTQEKIMETIAGGDKNNE